MTITVNAEFLKRWWPLAVPVLTDLWHVWKPHLSMVVIEHPNATIWIASLSVIIAYILKSPIVPSGTNGVIIRPTILESAVAAAREKAQRK